MAEIHVHAKKLHFNDKIYDCAVGKNGFAENKREGDGRTPIGTFSLRECWYRADRMDSPTTHLKCKKITAKDGWCDDTIHPQYNKHVKLPFKGNHEKLFRKEHVYDIIVPLGYNDAPVTPGKGSAIFMHIAHEDYRGTEGCIALSLSDLKEILKDCDDKTTISIFAS